MKRKRGSLCLLFGLICAFLCMCPAIAQVGVNGQTRQPNNTVRASTKQHATRAKPKVYRKLPPTQLELLLNRIEALEEQVDKLEKRVQKLEGVK